jgi:hypothetical protein
MRAKGPGESALLLLDAVAVLTDEGVEYAVIGAMAASVHGKVRASLDADAVLGVGPARLRQLEKRFTAEHFHTELREGDAEDPVPGVLALCDAHGNQVDLLAALRGMDPAAFQRAVTIPFQGASLRVIGREDFIAMKLFAGGPKDLMDASAVLQAGGPPLDLELLRQLAGRFGRPTLEALEKVLV